MIKIYFRKSQWIKRRKIKFIQADILNIEEIRHYNDADTIHHLAGITDVAYVKKDSNREQDEEIKKVAIKGTDNVLKSMNSNAKISYFHLHM